MLSTCKRISISSNRTYERFRRRRDCRRAAGDADRPEDCSFYLARGSAGTRGAAGACVRPLPNVVSYLSAKMRAPDALCVELESPSQWFSGVKALHNLKLRSTGRAQPATCLLANTRLWRDRHFVVRLIHHMGVGAEAVFAGHASQPSAAPETYRYVAGETPMLAYANTHAVLEERRRAAQAAGPSVRPPNSCT